MTLRDALTGKVQGELDSSPQALDLASRDASLFAIRPELIVRPKDARDIATIVTVVNEQRKTPGNHASITARAAGTDMAGGPLNTSLILDMTAHLNHLLELGEPYAIVEPGMFFRDFDMETKKHDLELPSYTGSRDLNTVGGMVANNSGGEKNLKFGKTARYVESLDMVLADGRIYTLQPLAGEALKAKCAQQDFEGNVYRQVSALISRHKDIIKAHAPQVEKNSSGYALWDMGDGIETLNLARLMTGAQGTLGIITKIRFSLVHPKPYSAMAVLFVRSLSELGLLVPEVLKHQPDSFESYDDHTFALGVKYFPEFAAQMKANILSLTISFLPEMWMMLTVGVPKLVLMVEFRASTQEEALRKAEDLASEIETTQPHVSARVAGSEKASRKYWVIRRESFNLLRKKIHNRRTAPFIDDFVVPPSSLPEFLPKLEEILSHYTLTYTIAGHVGDGNFHIIPLVDPTQKGLPRIIDELSHKVYDLVLSYHGSITGEHNDGLIRTPYVEKMFGPEMYGLFLEVKKIFDPLNIFNPGKKVGTTFSDAYAHLDLPKN